MITIATLRTAGLTEAQILKVLETEQAERLAKVREQNRIRQRNQRERNDVTRDVRDVRDVRDGVNALSLSKKEDLKETKKERATGQICPLDFKANEGDYEVGHEYGHSRQQVDGKAVDLRDWSHANRNQAKARKSDWHLTLRGALRRDGKPQGAVTSIGMTPEEYHRKFTNGGGNGDKAGQVDAVDGRGTQSEDREEQLL